MDEDRDWLKNPILPRPPALPRFTAAELRLVEDERERPSGVMRTLARQERSAPLASQLSSRRARRLPQSGRGELESEAPESRRIA